jgi:hypothetical protein
VFSHKVTSGLLVDKVLTTCILLVGSLLAFVGGTLVEEALVMSGFLLFASSLFVDMALAGRRLEAMMLIRSQGID